MTTMPLNGSGIIRRVARGLEQAPRASAAELIRFTLSHDDDAPDGTGASTKSRAVDPSQGFGNRRVKQRDPLAVALSRI